MFPAPIERRSAPVQTMYRIALPVALILWLLPLIAVALTSVRSAGDITAGNYWGWPTSINLIENYTAIFENTPIGKYILNSFRVTIPTVIGAVALSCMTGFALAVYGFRGNLLVFFMFVAGKLRAVPDPHGSGPGPDASVGALQHDHRIGPVPHRVPDWDSARCSCGISSRPCRRN